MIYLLVQWWPLSSIKQVKERANQVWGDEDKLEQAKEDKIEKREIQKQKKFDKKVKGKYRQNKFEIMNKLW